MLKNENTIISILKQRRASLFYFQSVNASVGTVSCINRIRTNYKGHKYVVTIEPSGPSRCFMN